MKAIKPIRIRPVHVSTPQCCVTPDEPTRLKKWRQQRYLKLRPHFDPMLCQHESAFEIDGKNYCRAHAGQIALNKWLNGELTEAVK